MKLDELRYFHFCEFTSHVDGVYTSSLEKYSGNESVVFGKGEGKTLAEARGEALENARGFIRGNWEVVEKCAWAGEIEKPAISPKPKKKSIPMARLNHLQILSKIAELRKSGKPLLLDLFCGAGGASAGYVQAGFVVLGVDLYPQKHYPYAFVQGNALRFLALYGHLFDAIHASPMCQGYSHCTPEAYKGNHKKIIPLVRKRLIENGKPYIIENVAGARKELINPLMLCGTMFDANLWRHRFFEYQGFAIPLPPPCNHVKFPTPVLVTGTHKRKGIKRVENTIAEKKEAMRIDWMTTNEIDQAIPPFFTSYIARYLMMAIRGEQVGNIQQVLFPIAA